VHEGLNLVSNSLVLPHHNTFGKSWAPKLLQKIPDVTLIGIDERTGMLNNGENNTWNIYGAGKVTLYRNGASKAFSVGDVFSV
jgi:hypothetical protein